MRHEWRCPGHLPNELLIVQAAKALGILSVATQLEKDLTATQKRLEAAEKARDTAVKTLEQAATRGTASRKPQQ